MGGFSVSVLLVNSNEELSDFIAKGLGELGRTVDRAKNASDGFFLATNARYECVIIARVLDDVCGLSLLNFLRANNVDQPIIVICGKYQLKDTLAAFEYGADDVMCEPIRIAELAARMRVVGRRAGPAMQECVLTVADLTLNRLTHQVRRGEVEIRLQPRSYHLLEILMENAGSIVTRATLLESVWGYHFDPQTSVIETHISRLREKIDRRFPDPLIRTVRGGGYMIGEPDQMSGAA